MTDALDQADANFKAGKFKQALKQYQDIIEADPENALAFQGLAAVSYRLNRNGDAVMAARKALELNPKLPIPHSILGDVYDRCHRIDESIDEFRQALALNPDQYGALIMLGGILATFPMRLDEGEALLTRAIELDPKASYPNCILVQIYIRQRRFGKAREAISRAFNLSPSLGTAFNIGYRVLSAFPLVRMAIFLMMIYLLIRTAESISILRALFIPGFIIIYAWLGIISLRLGKRWFAVISFIAVLYFVLMLVGQWSPS
jgi:tetratricopeptide (TPR) repeat protein